ncbi:LuxR C-terminal-related transcriptional regulator [Nitriliruptor alkaliphilus]|uniref:LuxR C-terminal-related transcriptional regulator n=1 Tax=Nitriliruptor alkaliphilus TaxID=427918 RepID=UPI000695DF2A|nr:LuxR C-terminal-related transcriptional regulator [Nitriliruptor alkaliphilus]
MTSSPHRLPATTTRLVGRRRELAEVRRLLGEARLVTLTGVGGIGKTRLALEVADQVRRAFPDGIRFVDLATVSDGEQVPEAVATACGVAERSTRPPLAQLADHLDGRRILVVLDNCEHLLDAVGALVDGLLRHTAAARVLATSRHVLGVPGEYLVPVAPLAVPDPAVVASAAAIREIEAVTLLIDRVTAVAPEFAVTDANAADVATLCRQLDGLPLAIELAASRLRTLSAEQVVHRMTRRFALLTGGSRTAQPRQQTLQSLVDWSYSLCEPAERLLWARLSVFAGSFDLAAVEGVCADAELPAESMVELLDRLVAQSLVAIEPGGQQVRFRLLETIRQYGRERLTEHGQVVALQRRHRDHYLALAERTAERWYGPDQAEALGRQRADHANLQAALETALADPADPAPALRLVVALRYHWCTDGYLTDGRRWLERVLHFAAPDDALRAEVQWVAAWVSLLQGDLPVADRHLADCRALAERTGDRRIAGFATSFQGTAALFRGDLELAADRLAEAVRDLDERGETDGQLWALFQLAITLSHQGHHDRAEATCRRSLEISAARGEQMCRSYTLWVLGFNTWRRGSPEEATQLVVEGLTIQRRFRDPVGVALMIEVLAWIAASEGALPLATSRLAAARAVWASIGTTIEAFGPPLVRHHDACVARLATGPTSRPDRTYAGRTVAVREIIDGVLAAVPAHGPGRRSEPQDLPVEVEPDHAEWSSGSGPDLCALTTREREVAELLAQGQTNRAIAASLVISPRTVDGHVERILAKLGFTSRTQVAAWLVTRRA